MVEGQFKSLSARNPSYSNKSNPVAGGGCVQGQGSVWDFQTCVWLALVIISINVCFEQSREEENEEKNAKTSLYGNTIHGQCTQGTNAILYVINSCLCYK